MGLFGNLFKREGSIDYIKQIDEDLYAEIHLLTRLEESSKEKLELINKFLSTWDKGKLKKLQCITEKTEDIIDKESDTISSFLKKLDQENKDLLALLNENYSGKLKEAMQKLREVVFFYKSNISEQKKFFDQTIDSLWTKRKEIKSLFKLVHQEAEIIETAKDDLDKVEDKLKYVHHISKDNIIILLKKHNIFTPKVIEALNQAEKSHKNQLRDNGADYLKEHIYGVVSELILFCDNKGTRPTENLICGAILHDALEDDLSLTKETFISKFGGRLYHIVAPLKKPDLQRFPGKSEEEKKMNLNQVYFEQLREAPYETKIIKLADRVNNLSYIAYAKPKKRKFYLKETNLFHLPFAKQTSDYFYRRIRSLYNSLVLLEKRTKT
ncbi:MAG: HD domain-containing protein [Candidatus Woesearchaeota archaeon]